MTNNITYEFNRYHGTPTMEITYNNGKKGFLSPFRGYRFQVSETPNGIGLISESMTNTRMHELATISCGRAVLTRLALDALERANADGISSTSLKKLIDDSILWLQKNANNINNDNDVYQAFDTYHNEGRDLT